MYGMDGMDNETRWYWNRYQFALDSHRNGNEEIAEDTIKMLVHDFRSPIFCKVQAWQLRSLVVDTHWTSRRYLLEAMKILDTLDQEDEHVKKHREHTERMIDKLDDDWEVLWLTVGKHPPPSEPGSEEDGWEWEIGETLGDEEEGVEEEGEALVRSEDSNGAEVKNEADETLEAPQSDLSTVAESEVDVKDGKGTVGVEGGASVDGAKVDRDFQG